MEDGCCVPSKQMPLIAGWHRIMILGQLSSTCRDAFLQVTLFQYEMNLPRTSAFLAKSRKSILHETSPRSLLSTNQEFSRNCWYSQAAGLLPTNFEWRMVEPLLGYKQVPWHVLNFHAQQPMCDREAMHQDS